MDKLDEYYGKDGLPSKCTKCKKEYPEIVFPACDQVEPICIDCTMKTNMNMEINVEVSDIGKFTIICEPDKACRIRRLISLGESEWYEV